MTTIAYGWYSYTWESTTELFTTKLDELCQGITRETYHDCDQLIDAITWELGRCELALLREHRAAAQKLFETLRYRDRLELIKAGAHDAADRGERRAFWLEILDSE